MKFLPHFVLSLLFLSVFACSKDNGRPKLVGFSEGGNKDYLTCKINGKEYAFVGKPVWSPEGVGYYYGLMGAGTAGYPLVRTFAITGNDIGTQKAEVNLEFNYDTSYRIPLHQKIFVDKNPPVHQVFVSLRTEDYKDIYYYAKPGSGWIQFSRADSIGAGTFAFTAYSSTDSLVVTDGRFDIRD